MAANKLYLGNDHVVRVTELADEDGDPVESATAEWTLSTTGSTPTEIAAGTLTGGAGGDYAGTIDAADFADLAVGTVVRITVTAEDGGRDGQWSETRIVSYRGFDC